MRTTVYIVTVDLGTSSTKTALWNTAGVPVAEATAGYELHRPDAVRAEIDPERWWDAVCTTVAEVLAAGGIAGRDVAAVAVDGMGWTLVPVDDAFRPLAPAMTCSTGVPRSRPRPCAPDLPLPG